MRIGLGSTVLMRGLMTHMDGIGVYSMNLLHNLRSLGVDTRSIIFNGNEYASVPANFFLRPLSSFPYKYTTYSSYSLMTGLSFPFSSMAKGIDLFHAPDHNIPKLSHVPVVATIMDAIPLVCPEWASPRLRTLKNYAFKRAAKWARHIITISEYSKMELIEHFNLAEECITVTPLGVDRSFFCRIPECTRSAVLSRYGLQPGFFIFVGTLQPRKNVQRIIDAHRSLQKKARFAHPLVIVGNYGWGIDDHLIESLRGLENEDTGRWLRNINHNELLSLLQSSVALVYPSLYEGFGLPVLEGFASAIPVITSKTTSLPEVAGDAALLVNPEATEEIAEAMRRLLEEEALSMTMVEKGLARVSCFSWERCARETIEVYQRVLSTQNSCF